jgi:hypothetical protein
MKLVTHLSLIIVIPLVSTLTLVCAQSGTTPGVRGRTDPVQREMERKIEMAIIENALRESPSRPPERYQPLVLEQIREDFLQIQVVDRKLAHALSTNDLPDLEFVKRSASEIKKRAVRLKKNLALPVPPEPNAGAAAQANAVQVDPARLRSSLFTLSNLIDQFVTNPVFKESRLIDANLSAKALEDIEGIIELSGQIKLSSEKLKRTSPQVRMTRPMALA